MEDLLKYSELGANAIIVLLFIYLVTKYVLELTRQFIVAIEAQRTQHLAHETAQRTDFLNALNENRQEFIAETRIIRAEFLAATALQRSESIAVLREHNDDFKEALRQVSAALVVEFECYLRKPAL